MVEAFLMGGHMMWPLALIGVGVLWLAGRTAWRIRREHQLAEAALSLQAILFWGAMSAVLGMLGTALGWISAARAIAAAGAVEPGLVWAGIGVTLHTVTFGMLIFTIAAFCWFVLRQWASRTAGWDRRHTSTDPG